MIQYLLLFCLLLGSPSVSTAQEILVPVAPMKGADQLPTFRADCVSGPDYYSCADRRLQEFIYGHLQYPENAKKRGVEGMAVVTFVVEIDGTVSGVEVVRDPGYGTGLEAARLVRLMNDQGPLWAPGMQGGEPARMQYNLPVKFSLEQ